MKLMTALLAASLLSIGAPALAGPAGSINVGNENAVGMGGNEDQYSGNSAWHGSMACHRHHHHHRGCYHRRPPNQTNHASVDAPGPR